MRETHISREKAKALIDDSQFGYVLAGQVEPKPVVGTVKKSNQEYQGKIGAYHFGDVTFNE